MTERDNVQTYLDEGMTDDEARSTAKKNRIDAERGIKELA